MFRRMKIKVAPNVNKKSVKLNVKANVFPNNDSQQNEKDTELVANILSESINNVTDMEENILSENTENEEVKNVFNLEVKDKNYPKKAELFENFIDKEKCENIFQSDLLLVDSICNTKVGDVKNVDQLPIDSQNEINTAKNIEILKSDFFENKVRRMKIKVAPNVKKKSVKLNVKANVFPNNDSQQNEKDTELVANILSESINNVTDMEENILSENTENEEVKNVFNLEVKDKNYPKKAELFENFIDKEKCENIFQSDLLLVDSICNTKVGDVKNVDQLPIDSQNEINTAKNIEILKSDFFENTEVRRMKIKVAPNVKKKSVKLNVKANVFPNNDSQQNEKDTELVTNILSESINNVTDMKENILSENTESEEVKNVFNLEVKDKNYPKKAELFENFIDKEKCENIFQSDLLLVDSICNTKVGDVKNVDQLPIDSQNEINTAKNIEILKSDFFENTEVHKLKKVTSVGSKRYKDVSHVKDVLQSFPLSAPPDRKKMKMSDLIFWNPSSNYLTESKDKEGVSENSILNESEIELAVEEEGLLNSNEDPEIIDNQENMEDRINLAPQLKIGPNGELVIDEKSLTVKTTEAKNRDFILKNFKVVEETDENRPNFNKRKARTNSWTKNETLRFYKALACIGTDFSLMNKYMPWRNRGQLKNKFKCEEKQRKDLVDLVIMNAKFDVNALESFSEFDSVQDRKNYIKERQKLKREILKENKKWTRENKRKEKISKREEKKRKSLLKSSLKLKAKEERKEMKRLQKQNAKMKKGESSSAQILTSAKKSERLQIKKDAKNRSKNRNKNIRNVKVQTNKNLKKSEAQQEDCSSLLFDLGENPVNVMEPDSTTVDSEIEHKNIRVDSQQKSIFAADIPQENIVAGKSNLNNNKVQDRAIQQSKEVDETEVVSNVLEEKESALVSYIREHEINSAAVIKIESSEVEIFDPFTHVGLFNEGEESDNENENYPNENWENKNQDSLNKFSENENRDYPKENDENKSQDYSNENKSQDYSNDENESQDYLNENDENNSQDYSNENDENKSQDYSNVNDENESQDYSNGSGENKSQDYSNGSGENKNEDYLNENVENKSQYYLSENDENRSHDYSNENKSQDYLKKNDKNKNEDYPNENYEYTIQGTNLNENDENRTQDNVKENRVDPKEKIMNDLNRASNIIEQDSLNEYPKSVSATARQHIVVINNDWSDIVTENNEYLILKEERADSKMKQITNAESVDIKLEEEIKNSENEKPIKENVTTLNDGSESFSSVLPLSDSVCSDFEKIKSILEKTLIQENFNQHTFNSNSKPVEELLDPTAVDWIKTRLESNQDKSEHYTLNVDGKEYDVQVFQDLLAPPIQLSSNQLSPIQSDRPLQSNRLNPPAVQSIQKEISNVLNFKQSSESEINTEATHVDLSIVVNTSVQIPQIKEIKQTKPEKIQENMKTYHSIPDTTQTIPKLRQTKFEVNKLTPSCENLKINQIATAHANFENSQMAPKIKQGPIDANFQFDQTASNANFDLNSELSPMNFKVNSKLAQSNFNIMEKKRKNSESPESVGLEPEQEELSDTYEATSPSDILDELEQYLEQVSEHQDEKICHRDQTLEELHEIDIGSNFDQSKERKQQELDQRKYEQLRRQSGQKLYQKHKILDQTKEIAELRNRAFEKHQYTQKLEKDHPSFPNLSPLQTEETSDLKNRTFDQHQYDQILEQGYLSQTFHKLDKINKFSQRNQTLDRQRYLIESQNLRKPSNNQLPDKICPQLDQKYQKGEKGLGNNPEKYLKRKHPDLNVSNISEKDLSRLSISSSSSRLENCFSRPGSSNSVNLYPTPRRTYDTQAVCLSSREKRPTSVSIQRISDKTHVHKYSERPYSVDIIGPDVRTFKKPRPSVDIFLDRDLKSATQNRDTSVDKLDSSFEINLRNSDLSDLEVLSPQSFKLNRKISHSNFIRNSPSHAEVSNSNDFVQFNSSQNFRSNSRGLVCKSHKSNSVSDICSGRRVTSSPEFEEYSQSVDRRINRPHLLQSGRYIQIGNTIRTKDGFLPSQSSSSNRRTAKRGFLPPQSSSSNRRTSESEFLPSQSSSSNRTVESGFLPYQSNSSNRRTSEIDILPQQSSNSSRTEESGFLPYQSSTDRRIGERIFSPQSSRCNRRTSESEFLPSQISSSNRRTGESNFSPYQSSTDRRIGERIFSPQSSRCNRRTSESEFLPSQISSSNRRTDEVGFLPSQSSSNDGRTSETGILPSESSQFKNYMCSKSMENKERLNDFLNPRVEDNCINAKRYSPRSTSSSLMKNSRVPSRNQGFRPYISNRKTPNFGSRELQEISSPVPQEYRKLPTFESNEFQKFGSEKFQKTRSRVPQKMPSYESHDIQKLSNSVFQEFLRSPTSVSQNFSESESMNTDQSELQDPGVKNVAYPISAIQKTQDGKYFIEHATRRGIKKIGVPKVGPEVAKIVIMEDRNNRTGELIYHVFTADRTEEIID